MRKLALSVAAALFAGQALAADVTTYKFDGSFDDAAFAVENAIVNEGLVIDYVSHIGEMLERTGADVGSDVKIFDAAESYLFCSAQISRKVMEADPLNIGHCPYSVFVIDRGGNVEIGHRNMPEGEMQEVQALLDRIAKEAAGK